MRSPADRFFQLAFFVLGSLALATGLLWWSAIPVRHVLTMLLTTIIIAAAMRRPVAFFARYHIPKSLTILLLYVGFIAMCAWTSVRVIPMVSQQLNAMAANLPRNAETLRQVLNFLPPEMADWTTANVQKNLPELSSHVAGFATYLSSFVGTVVSLSLDTVIVLVMAFLLAKEEGIISRFVNRFVKRPYEPAVTRMIDGIMLQLGQWSCGQLIVSAFFALAFSGMLSLLGVQYAVTIGLVALVLECVLPWIGGIIAMMLALTVVIPAAGLAGGAMGALFVVVGWLGIMKVQWNVVAPSVMDRYLRIHPMISIMSIWIAFMVFGIMGSLLGLPAAVIIINVLDYAHPDDGHLPLPGEAEVAAVPDATPDANAHAAPGATEVTADPPAADATDKTG